RGQRGERGDEGREEVEDVDGRGGEEAFLADQLQQVGDRLQEPERTGTVRAVAELHPPHHLALGKRQGRERDQGDVDDHERLDQRDPPGLAVDVENERRHALSTSTVGWRSPACSSAIRTTPGISLRSSRARSSTLVPFDLTCTRSPFPISRRSASAVAS